MKLSYKARRRLSLLVLLVWTPIVIAAVVSIMNAIDRPPFLIEAFIYIFAGVFCFYPFKFVFMGVGKADPDAEDQE